MNALEHIDIKDTRETVEEEFSKLVFEECMDRVDAGEISYNEARLQWHERTQPMSFTQTAGSVALYGTAEH